MSQTISAKNSRRFVMMIIAGAFVVALITLFYIARGGAISEDNLFNAALKLFGYYSPVLSIIGAFYLKDKRGGGRDSRILKTSFYFAVFVIAFWMLIPILLLFFQDYIESVLKWIENINSALVFLVNLAVAYFFSKDNNADGDH